MSQHEAVNTFLQEITPVVLTYNEAPNIDRVLNKLRWAKRVLVVDSGSDDGTIDILRRHENVVALHRTFDSHSSQWNFAVGHPQINTEWVLALDSDYVLTDALVEELSRTAPTLSCSGYTTHFKYCVYGKPLHGTLYPPSTTLFRRERGRYVQDGHTQRLELKGTVEELQSYILHDDRKPLSRWLWAQERYAALEVRHLLATPSRELSLQDRLRSLMVITPWLVPLYCLTVGRGLLDGWHGIFYALQRGIAESVLALKLLEARLTK